MLPRRVDPFFHLVERRIAEAESAGAFDRLPGRGRPLDLPDLSGVPAELRASYILLQTAGFVPPELEARKEWLRLEDLLALCRDTHEAAALRRQAQRARLRYRLLMEQRGGGGASWAEYHERILQRLERGG
ncbi:MAG: DUF1992 domain-containing protein [Planctomycetes bacterium]|nr:DUF1992 domain-containing protein [Planctomycetota bacterium]